MKPSVWAAFTSLSSEVMEDLEKVIRQGMVVVVKSQCPYEGSDLSVYETGHAALKAGVISGLRYEHEGRW